METHRCPLLQRPDVYRKPRCAASNVEVEGIFSHLPIPMQSSFRNARLQLDTLPGKCCTSMKKNSLPMPIGIWPIRLQFLQLKGKPPVDMVRPGYACSMGYFPADKKLPRTVAVRPAAGLEKAALVYFSRWSRPDIRSATVPPGSPTSSDGRCASSRYRFGYR